MDGKLSAKSGTSKNISILLIAVMLIGMFVNFGSAGLENVFASDAAIIVDDKDAGYIESTAASEDTQTAADYKLPYNGSMRDFKGAAGVLGAWAQWTPTITETGEYDIYMYVPWANDQAFSDKMQLEIAYADANGDIVKDTTKYVNQRLVRKWNIDGKDAMLGTWGKVGTYQLKAGTECYVKMTIGSSVSSARMITDAVAFVPKGGQPPANHEGAVSPEPTPTPVEGLYEYTLYQNKNNVVAMGTINGPDIPTGWTTDATVYWNATGSYVAGGQNLVMAKGPAGTPYYFEYTVPKEELGESGQYKMYLYSPHTDQCTDGQALITQDGAEIANFTNVNMQGIDKDWKEIGDITIDNTKDLKFKFTGSSSTNFRIDTIRLVKSGAAIPSPSP